MVDRSSIQRCDRDVILVVDDSPASRRAIVRRLQSAGVLCREAATLPEIQGLDANEWDAAILDVELGDTDGLTVARTLLKAKPTLRIAFLSGGIAGDKRDTLEKIGPVFIKDARLDAVVDWATIALSPARALRGDR